MRFICKFRNTDFSGEPWDEDYDKPDIHTIDEAYHYARRTVAGFNSTLRPYEKARTLIGVRPADGIGNHSPHTWEKVSLVTESNRKKYYDRMRCTVCGITGKRFNFTEVTRDSEFKAKGFGNCARSIELLKKRAQNGRN